MLVIDSDKLRLIIAENGYTVASFCRVAGLSQAAMLAWFRGQRVPRLLSIAKMAKALNMPLKQLTEELAVEEH